MPICKFTIIIPTYNNLFLLQNALGYIFSQSNNNYEIIIIDDSNTIDIENYIHSCNYINVIYYHNIPSLGAVKNWNYGLSLATGDYIVLLHHDEYFINNINFFNDCLKSFGDNFDVIVLNPIVKLNNGDIKRQNIPYFIKIMVLKYFKSLLFAVNIIGPTSCIVFKRSKLKYFNEKLKWLVDIDWYYNILKGNKIKIDNTLFIGSIHGHEFQITNSIDIKQTEKEDRKILINYYGRFSKVSFALCLRSIIYKIKSIIFKNQNPIWKKIC